jgi:hypothetical protein
MGVFSTSFIAAAFTARSATQTAHTKATGVKVLIAAAVPCEYAKYIVGVQEVEVSYDSWWCFVLLFSPRRFTHSNERDSVVMVGVHVFRDFC